MIGWARASEREEREWVREEEEERASERGVREEWNHALDRWLLTITYVRWLIYHPPNIRLYLTASRVTVQRNYYIRRLLDMTSQADVIFNGNNTVVFRFPIVRYRSNIREACKLVLPTIPRPRWSIEIYARSSQTLHNEPKEHQILGHVRTGIGSLRA